MRHSGAILDWQDCDELAGRLEAAGRDFVVEPHVRFKDMSQIFRLYG